MKHTIFTWSLLALAILMTGGCVGQTPISNISAVTPTTPASEEIDAAPAAATITEIALGGDEETFLETIAAAANAQDAPFSHRFVEFDDAAGQRWQGEALIDGDNQRVFLQPMLGGGREGVLIESAVDADIGALVADFGPDTPSVERAPTIFPEIRFVHARETNAGVWAFDVTLAYPDTGWDDYADGWHAETPDGEVLGTRILLHPHVNEQPFTRSLSGVAVPEGITMVNIRSHALVNGYGPEPAAIPLDQAAATEFFEVTKYE